MEKEELIALMKLINDASKNRDGSINQAAFIAHHEFNNLLKSLHEYTPLAGSSDSQLIVLKSSVIQKDEAFSLSSDEEYELIGGNVSYDETSRKLTSYDIDGVEKLYEDITPETDGSFIIDGKKHTISES